VPQPSFGGDAADFTEQGVTLPGVTRTFTLRSQCSPEIAEPRVCGGLYFRPAANTGLVHGRQVASR